MDCTKLSFRETGLFSQLMVDYVEGNPQLKPFYSNPPTLEGLKNTLLAKDFTLENRHTLVQVLQEQYATTETPDIVNQHMAALADKNTFTVTTGHQLNIFTGPLFYIYKLVATINLANKLQAAYPAYHFVPVYWMGSEDHDYEEINHLYIHGKKYEWQTPQRGATGRFTTEGLAELLEQLPGNTRVFEEALKKHTLLADAVRAYVNTLLGNQGLVCLDADDARLKKIFLPVIKDELINESSRPLVEAQSQALSKAGYKQQLQPRELNLFYLTDTFRNRLVKEGEVFKVVDTDIEFTENQLKEELAEYPERFSPNVILRPVYQETILPNIAYVGGPSELAYWFQLKKVFEHFKLAFPVLMPRSFVLYISPRASHKMDKLNVPIPDLFLRKDLFINTYIKSSSNGQLSLKEAEEQLLNVFVNVKQKAEQVDATLSGLVESERVKAQQSLVRVAKKMLKAAKRKHTDEVRMLHEIYEEVYPAGIPHERRENILAIDNPEFINQLLELLNPLELTYLVLKA